jgi:hypothetical protein
MTERPDDSPDAPESPPGDHSATVTPDVSPLLTLEPAPTENTGENRAAPADSNQPDLLGPLLGTIALDGIETLGKLSSGRSPKRQCYGNVLRFRATVEQRNLRKTARNRSDDCSAIYRAKCDRSKSAKRSLCIAS